MRERMRSWVVWAAAALALVCFGLGAPGDAAAVGITLPFSVELGPQRTGDFGLLEIEEIDGGALAFTITLNTSVLGKKADLHEFYFNLSGDFDDDDDGNGHRGLARGRDDDWDDDDVWISDFRCNGVRCGTAFDLDEGGPTRGGAGARFDFSVNFGNGKGKNGNGILQVASFVLRAEQDLTLADVLGETSSTGRGLEVIFAAHVTGSGNGKGSGSATIGVVPEPATALLFGLGLVGLAAGGSRRRS